MNTRSDDWDRLIYDELDDGLTTDLNGNWSFYISRLYQAIIIQVDDYHPNPLIIRKNQLIEILKLLNEQD